VVIGVLLSKWVGAKVGLPCLQAKLQNYALV
jgi:hypothetical protein